MVDQTTGEEPLRCRAKACCFNIKVESRGTFYFPIYEGSDIRLAMGHWVSLPSCMALAAPTFAHRSMIVDVFGHGTRALEWQ